MCLNIFEFYACMKSDQLLTIYQNMLQDIAIDWVICLVKPRPSRKRSLVFDVEGKILDDCVGVNSVFTTV